MHIIKPPHIQRGDVIGICAPAGPPNRNALEKGIQYIESLGYRVTLSRNIFRRHGYLAGTDRQRVSDLHELFLDKKVKVIFAARGGYGTQRILPLLNYSLIKKKPKLVVGYSDITALQLALFTKAGLTSVTGPVVADMPGTFRKQSEELFWRTLTSTKPLPPLQSNPEFKIPTGQRFSTGKLMGGNLSLITALIGTPFFPRRNDMILLLEDIDERPYRLDRYLQQVKLNGVIARSKGVVLGDFTDCTPAKGKPSLSIASVFQETFQDYSYPIVSGFRYGHVKNSLTLPIGVTVTLDSKRNEVKFLDSAVS